MALPSLGVETTSAAALSETPKTGGDDGWLTQLRDSIASALPAPSENEQTAATPSANTESKAPKDEAVTDFFASLLKNP